MDLTDAYYSLKIKVIRGFSYKKENSILLTKIPRIGILFYLECSLRFFDSEKYQQIHTTQNKISAITLNDKWLAIGEKMFKGQLTNTTFLNLQTKEVQIFKYQKTITSYLSISKHGQYICSAGSSNEMKQQLFIVDIEGTESESTGKLILSESSTKNSGKITGVTFSNNNNNMLSVLYTNKLIIIQIQGNLIDKKVAKSNKVRQFSMMLFDPWDKFCFACSKNGDISEISLAQLKQTRVGPRKRVIIAGIKHIRYLHPEMLIITGVKGFIALIQIKELKIIKQATLNEQILTLTEFEGDLGFISTDKANIYVIEGSTLNIRPFSICHNSRINQICFVENFNDIFGTCAGSEIRIWNTYTVEPVLKIQLPKKQCLCLNLTKDGKHIISGWNDDCIRFFSPTTGKQTKKIENSHAGQVTAMISNPGSDRLISGGDNGSIRIWRLEKECLGLLENSFPGKCYVHHLQLKGDMLCCSGEDGSYTIWDIKNSLKISENRVNNFLKQIKMYDNYTLFGIGSGPNLFKIRKNDGEILQQIRLGGSFIDCFDSVSLSDGKQFYFLGGESHSVYLLQYNDNLLRKSKIETFDSFSSVTAIKISPDRKKLFVGTEKGFLLVFEIILA